MQLSLYRYFDWKLTLLTLTLTIIGVLFVFSSTYSCEAPYSLFFKKQLLGLLCGAVIYCSYAYLDYRTLMRWHYFGYLFLLALLGFTLIQGHIGMGGQRWINLGLFKFQPSELTKLFFPAFVAYYFHTHNLTTPISFKHFIPALIMLIASFVLIRQQPDLGTAIIIGLSGIIMLWIAGLDRSFFYICGVAMLLTAPLLWHGLRPYQKQRIAVFFGSGTKQNNRYHAEQSIIAVGSGALRGKGFMQGTQNNFQFLPERRTDSIFAVICEETGFCGAVLVIFLYLALIGRIIYRILYIKSPIIQLLAIGNLLPIMLSIAINSAMVLGLLPIVGIPLPLLSYGLTNLWVNCASLGWIQGILVQSNSPI